MASTVIPYSMVPCVCVWQVQVVKKRKTQREKGKRISAQACPGRKPESETVEKKKMEKKMQ
jgi:hypothetical protein